MQRRQAVLAFQKVPGIPDRTLPRSAVAATEIKKRTLTRLYNERPAWLANAHRDLDAAVAAAYGWPADISEEDEPARDDTKPVKNGRRPRHAGRAAARPRSDGARKGRKA